MPLKAENKEGSHRPQGGAGLTSGPPPCAGASSYSSGRRSFSSIATSAAGPAIAAAALTFTPGHAALGGAILGVATVGNLLLNGRVLGISGAVKGLVQGDRAAWRTALLAGMILAAIPAASFFPAAFDVLPASFSARAAVGGLLVGLGATMGNGCTSGHGICGNARLSPRSLAYTMTFMAAGAAAATLTDTLGALGVPAITPQYVPIPVPELQTGLAIAGVAAAAAAALAFAGRSMSNGSAKSALEMGSSFAFGSVFSMGLLISGMCHPSKVAAFLSPLSPAWDLSLMFVMGSAVGLSFPAFQSVLGKLWQTPSWAASPAITPAYCLPPSSGPGAKIDARLITGGLLFGAGWGLSGMCPGPAIVAAAATGSTPVLAYLAAVVAGVAVEPLLTKAWTAVSSNSTPKAVN